MAKDTITVKLGRIEVDVPQALANVDVLSDVFDRETWNQFVVQDEKKLRVRCQYILLICYSLSFCINYMPSSSRRFCRSAIMSICWECCLTARTIFALATTPCGSLLACCKILRVCAHVVVCLTLAYRGESNKSRPDPQPRTVSWR